MGEASKVIQQLKADAAANGATLEKVEVSRDMYDTLLKECSPLPLFEVFGIEISVLAEPGNKTLH